MTGSASAWKDAPSVGIILRVIIVLLAATTVVLVLGYPLQPVSDSEEYLRMAAGDAHHVDQPFANRVLHPLTVRAVSLVTRSDARVAFVIVSILSAMALVFTVAYFTRQSLPVMSFVALFATPLSVDLLRNIYLPDLFHAALVGLYLVALDRGLFSISLALLFALQLARESTLALVFIVVAVAVYRGRWQLAVGSAAASLLGLLIVAEVTRSGPSNIHGLGGVVYLFAKIPANCASNVFGVVPWTDTYALRFPDQYAAPPLWTTTVPSWLPTGNIQEVGVYRLDVMRPLNTAVSLLTTFGILPVVAWIVTPRTGNAILRTPPLALTVALVYGLVAYGLAPMTGVSVGRLIGYGWPAFWIATPVFLASRYRLGAGAATRVWCSLLACSWLPFLIGATAWSQANMYAAAAVSAAVLHAFVWWHLRSASGSALIS